MTYIKDNIPPQPQMPNFDGGNEPPNKPYENPQPPHDNGNPSQKPNGGNSQSPDFNEPTGRIIQMILVEVKTIFHRNRMTEMFFTATE